MVIIGNPENRRVSLFQDALIRQGHSPATVVSWLDLLTRKTNLEKILDTQKTVRIESPGENFEVERELLRLGFEQAQSDGVARLSPPELDRLVFDLGRILCPRQWYFGFSKILAELKTTVSRCGGVFMNDPDEIRIMFDKPQTHALCRKALIPVPDAIAGVTSLEQLLHEMKNRDWDRVFVKLANGSSASGVGALHVFKDGTMRLTCPVEIERDATGCRLYNSLKVRTYSRRHDICGVIDELCRHSVHVERWLPKAVQNGFPFDLRIVSIAAEPKHGVVRLGRGPITNLHLGNARGDFELLEQKLGPEKRDTLKRVCRDVAKLFSRSHVIGIDLLMTPRLRNIYVLELNAFGDLLPNVLYENRDTYETEVASWNDSLLPRAP